MRPSRVTATVRASSLSASFIVSGLLTFARSTGIPFCNIGVITMKMISNTSMTSTMGVTLMFELTFAPSFLMLIAIILLLRRRVRRNQAPNPATQHDSISRRGGCPHPPARTRASGPTWAVLPAHSSALQEVINQLARGVVHLHVESFHAARQIGEHHDGGNRDCQPDRRGHKRF